MKNKMKKNIDKKSKSKITPFLAGVFICAIIMIFGGLERNRIILMIGGVGFLIFLGILILEWASE